MQKLLQFILSHIRGNCFKFPLLIWGRQGTSKDIYQGSDMILDVTVVIPIFNRSHTLRRALASVVAQTQRPREVIVVDDGSSDQCLAEVKTIVAQFSQSLRINLIVNEINRGANNARNRGILQAKSAYIAFLDSDDLWLPEKLAKQMSEIRKAKGNEERPILSATGRYRVNSKGDIIARQLGGSSFNPVLITSSNLIGTLSSVIVETSVVKKIGGFDERLPACQDWDFFIRLAEYVQFVGIRDTLCIYVDHDKERISGNHRKRIRAHLHILRKYKSVRNSCATIYRNIAEDYQEAGEPAKAATFLARSFASRRFPNRWARTVFELILIMYFRYKLPRSLKERRYIGYRKALARDMANPHIFAKVQEDAALLKKLMAEQSANLGAKCCS